MMSAASGAELAEEWRRVVDLNALLACSARRERLCEFWDDYSMIRAGSLDDMAAVAHLTDDHRLERVSLIRMLHLLGVTSLSRQSEQEETLSKALYAMVDLLGGASALPSHIDAQVSKSTFACHALQDSKLMITDFVQRDCAELMSNIRSMRANGAIYATSSSRGGKSRGAHDGEATWVCPTKRSARAGYDKRGALLHSLLGCAEEELLLPDAGDHCSGMQAKGTCTTYRAWESQLRRGLLHCAQQVHERQQKLAAALRHVAGELPSSAFSEAEGRRHGECLAKARVCEATTEHRTAETPVWVALVHAVDEMVYEAQRALLLSVYRTLHHLFSSVDGGEAGACPLFSIPVQCKGVTPDHTDGSTAGGLGKLDVHLPDSCFGDAMLRLLRIDLIQCIMPRLTLAQALRTPLLAPAHPPPCERAREDSEVRYAVEEVCADVVRESQEVNRLITLLQADVKSAVHNVSQAGNDAKCRSSFDTEGSCLFDSCDVERFVYAFTTRRYLSSTGVVELDVDEVCAVVAALAKLHLCSVKAAMAPAMLERDDKKLACAAAAPVDGRADSHRLLFGLRIQRESIFPPSGAPGGSDLCDRLQSDLQKMRASQRRSSKYSSGLNPERHVLKLIAEMDKCRRPLAESAQRASSVAASLVEEIHQLTASVSVCTPSPAKQKDAASTAQQSLCGSEQPSLPKKPSLFDAVMPRAGKGAPPPAVLSATAHPSAPAASLVPQPLHDECTGSTSVPATARSTAQHSKRKPGSAEPTNHRSSSAVENGRCAGQDAPSDTFTARPADAPDAQRQDDRRHDMCAESAPAKASICAESAVRPTTTSTHPADNVPTAHLPGGCEQRRSERSEGDDAVVACGDANYPFLPSEPCPGIYLCDVNYACDSRFRAAVNRMIAKRNNTNMQGNNNTVEGEEKSIVAIVVSLATELREATFKAHFEMPFLGFRVHGVLLGTLLPRLEENRRFMSLLSLRQQIIRGASASADGNKARLTSMDKFLYERACILADIIAMSSSPSSSSPLRRKMQMETISSSRLDAEYEKYVQERMQERAKAEVRNGEPAESSQQAQQQMTGACSKLLHGSTRRQAAKDSPSHSPEKMAKSPAQKNNRDTCTTNDRSPNTVGLSLASAPVVAVQARQQQQPSERSSGLAEEAATLATKKSKPPEHSISAACPDSPSPSPPLHCTASIAELCYSTETAGKPEHTQQRSSSRHRMHEEHERAANVRDDGVNNASTALATPHTRTRPPMSHGLPKSQPHKSKRVYCGSTSVPSNLSSHVLCHATTPLNDKNSSNACMRRLSNKSLDKLHLCTPCLHCPVQQQRRDNSERLPANTTTEVGHRLDAKDSTIAVAPSNVSAKTSLIACANNSTLTKEASHANNNNNNSSSCNAPKLNAPSCTTDFAEKKGHNNALTSQEHLSGQISTGLVTTADRLPLAQMTSRKHSSSSITIRSGATENVIEQWLAELPSISPESNSISVSDPAPPLSSTAIVNTISETGGEVQKMDQKQPMLLQHTSSAVRTSTLPKSRSNRMLSAPVYPAANQQPPHGHDKQHHNPQSHTREMTTAPIIGQHQQQQQQQQTTKSASNNNSNSQEEQQQVRLCVQPQSNVPTPPAPSSELLGAIQGAAFALTKPGEPLHDPAHDPSRQNSSDTDISDVRHKDSPDTGMDRMRMRNSSKDKDNMTAESGEASIVTATITTQPAEPESVHPLLSTCATNPAIASLAHRESQPCTATHSTHLSLSATAATLPVYTSAAAASDAAKNHRNLYAQTSTTVVSMAYGKKQYLGTYNATRACFKESSSPPHHTMRTAAAAAAEPQRRSLSPMVYYARARPVQSAECVTAGTRNSAASPFAAASSRSECAAGCAAIQLRVNIAARKEKDIQKSSDNTTTIGNNNDANKDSSTTYDNKVSYTSNAMSNGTGYAQSPANGLNTYYATTTPATSPSAGAAHEPVAETSSLLTRNVRSLYKNLLDEQDAQCQKLAQFSLTGHASSGARYASNEREASYSGSAFKSKYEYLRSAIPSRAASASQYNESAVESVGKGSAHEEGDLASCASCENISAHATSYSPRDSWARRYSKENGIISNHNASAETGVQDNVSNRGSHASKRRLNGVDGDSMERDGSSTPTAGNENTYRCTNRRARDSFGASASPQGSVPAVLIRRSSWRYRADTSPSSRSYACSSASHTTRTVVALPRTSTTIPRSADGTISDSTLVKPMPSTWVSSMSPSQQARSQYTRSSPFSTYTHSRSATCARTAVLAELPPDMSLQDVYKATCAALCIRPNSQLLSVFPSTKATWLTQLDLSINYVGRKGLRPVLSVLERNGSHLEMLNLSNNNLENGEVVELVSLLEKSEAGARLSTLDISYNPISQTGGQALLRLRTSRTSIVCIRVKGTLISPRLMQSIEKKAAGECAPAL